MLDQAVAPLPSGGWRRSLAVSLAFFAAFRLLTEAVALVAAHGQRAARDAARGSGLDVWKHWDANWFLAIAEHGYRRLSPITGGGKTYDAVAFPPAYPGAIRALHAVLPGSLAAAGLVVSGVALIVAMVGLYRLVALDHGPRSAQAALFLLLIFPSSLFLGGIYAESMVLAAAAWAFLAARSGRWWLAGLLSGIAVLTKLYMVILCAALLVEYAQAHLWDWRRIRADLAWLFVPPAACLGAWMVYLQVQFGDPLRFLKAERYWDRHVAPPWVGLGRAVGTLVQVHFVGLVDLASIGVLVAATVYSMRRLRPAYSAFLGLGLVVLVSTSTIYSTNRLMIVFFPVFIAGALLVESRPWLERTLVATSLPLAIFLVARFTAGQWAG